MDWNHDGEHDWKDDALYNNVISGDGKTPPQGNKAPSHSDTPSRWWIALLLVWIVGLVIKCTGS